MTAVPARKRDRRDRPDLWSEVMSRRLPLAALYACGPMERIALVKAGVPARLVTVLVEDMAITKDKLYRTIGVARATMDRKGRAIVSDLLAQMESGAYA